MASILNYLLLPAAVIVQVHNMGISGRDCKSITSTPDCVESEGCKWHKAFGGCIDGSTWWTFWEELENAASEFPAQDSQKKVHEKMCKPMDEILCQNTHQVKGQA